MHQLIQFRLNEKLDELKTYSNQGPTPSIDQLRKVNKLQKELETRFVESKKNWG